MAAPPRDAVYAKTPQGSDEIATRRHGLGMRVRQLLILVDGRRNVADLAKLVPPPDLDVHLSTLEGQGFVARVEPVAGPRAAASPGLVAGAPLEPAAGRDLETLRRAVVRELVGAIGPHADDMAVRIERCRSVDELREVLGSVAALVEAVRGRAAVAELLQRLGPV